MYTSRPPGLCSRAGRVRFVLVYECSSPMDLFGRCEGGTTHAMNKVHNIVCHTAQGFKKSANSFTLGNARGNCWRNGPVLLNISSIHISLAYVQ